MGYIAGSLSRNIKAHVPLPPPVMTTTRSLAEKRFPGFIDEVTSIVTESVGEEVSFSKCESLGRCLAVTTSVHNCTERRIPAAVPAVMPL